MLSTKIIAALRVQKLCIFKNEQKFLPKYRGRGPRGDKGGGGYHQGSRHLFFSVLNVLFFSVLPNPHGGAGVPVCMTHTFSRIFIKNCVKI